MRATTTADVRKIVIIGGGASGALLACHLLRQDRRNVHITLIEKRAEIGRGTAYSTLEPQHVLNVRAINMSAFSDDPDHFCRWLEDLAGPSRDSAGYKMRFVPRRVYGQYLLDTLSAYTRLQDRSLRLALVNGEAIATAVDGAGAHVTLRDGRIIHGDIAVLAMGHEQWAPEDLSAVVDPWQRPADTGVRQSTTVLVQGAGLSMVDYVLALRANGHMGPIYAISRRGLLPMAHRATTSVAIQPEQVPFGSSLVTYVRWIRRLAEEANKNGGDWRSVIDAVRPFTASIWRDLSLPDRQRFLRHARPWWDIHRHRMAPEVESEIRRAMAADQLRVIAGKITSIEPEENRVLVTFRRRHAKASETLRVDRIVRCTGVSDPRKTTNALIANLLASRLARVDDLGLALDVTQDCRVIGGDGRASSRLYAIGPMTRGAFWEIVAIPDIRVQCAQLAAILADEPYAQAS